MENNRGMRFSIKLKILLGSVFVNILICAVMGITIYGFVSKSYIKSASEDTLALCEVAAFQINGNLLAVLDEGGDESYANTVIQEEMKTVDDNANLYAIYTVGERSGKLVYLSQPADYGIKIGAAVEDDYVEEMRDALKSDGHVSGYIEKGTTGEHFISAYAPIHNSDGKVVGILGIDYIVDDLVASLNAIIRTIVIIGLILSAGSGVVSILLADGIGYGLKSVDA